MQRPITFLIAFLAVTLTVHAKEHWETYENCQLMPNQANDGDSFHVRAKGEEFIFRLYFVDTPETSADFPDRVADQAKYFHLTVPQTLQVGLEAERYTRSKLSRPFTVITCKEDAHGQSRLPRYFAVVKIGNENLAEDLVANGLARVYGMKTQVPTVRSPAAEKAQLLQLEARARSQKLGAWGISEGRLNARAATATPSTKPGNGGDSFEAFFHPQAAADTPSADNKIEAPSTTAPGEKLDINTASIDALQNLPGIGVVMARRIIEARPFQSADELQRVAGIGPHRYQVLRPYFR